MLGNLLQQVCNMVDTAVVGQGGKDKAKTENRNNTAYPKKY